MATGAEAARHVFISTSRFRDLVAGGVISHQKNGRYSLDKVREQYILNAQKVMAGRGGADGGKQLSANRARLADAQARKVEFGNDIASGEYISARIIKTAIESAFLNIRETALSIAGKVSDRVSAHTEQDRIAVHAIIDREMREMLTALSTVDLHKATADDKDDDAKQEDDNDGEEEPA